VNKKERLKRLEQQVQRLADYAVKSEPRYAIRAGGQGIWDVELSWFVYEPRSMKHDELVGYTHELTRGHRVERKMHQDYKIGPWFDTKAKAEAYLKALEAGR
jgi:hypothetical protein